MAAPCGGILTKVFNLGTYCRWRTNNILPMLKFNESCQVRYAARKGTRERKQKKKAPKVEPKKVGFIPHNLRDGNKLKLPTTSRRTNDSWKSVSTDNVWIAKYHRWPVYNFAEAVYCHRQTHHPTIYNKPDAPLNVFIELNMTAAKKNKYVDNLNRMVSVPHAFDHGEDRSILVFCKTPELQKSALEAGAALAGGSELVKDIQSGKLVLQDFQYVIAHPNIMPEIVSVRGLLKRRFPNVGSGTLGPNVSEMVMKFRYGNKYTSSKDEHEQDYGWIETSIGKLDMDESHLEANLAALLQDVNSARPKREGPFITRCLLVCPPSVERLKISLEPYLTTENNTSVHEEGGVDEHEDEEEAKQAATSR